MNTIDQVVDAYGHTVTLSDMSDKAIVYAVTYGLRKSMQDSVAGLQAKLEKEGKTEAEIEQAIEEKMAKRFAAILAGDMDAGASVGPRLKGVDKVMADMAEEALRERFAQNKQKWPSGKGAADTINGLVAELVGKYADMPHEAFADSDGNPRTMREAAEARIKRRDAMASL